jgi:hypothetical protein
MAAITYFTARRTWTPARTDRTIDFEPNSGMNTSMNGEKYKY